MTRDKERPRGRSSAPRPARSGGKARGREADGGAATPDSAKRAAAPGNAAAKVQAPQRIAKLIARAGLCSRRDAEAWIIEGRVAVNGTVLTSPALDVGPADVIAVDGDVLPTLEKTRLFLFHKPRGLITSDHDPEGRSTVADHLRETWPEGPRVVTVGRLDINTEGLLLLTNDGGLARVLELPKTGWVRRYRVRAKGETDQGVLDTLRDGITIDGVDYAGIEAKLDRIQGANCWLTMGLREGKNREIKRVLEHLGLEVNRLIRLSFGPFQLLDLAEGQVSEVRTRILRDQLGDGLAAEAGAVFETEEDASPMRETPRLAERPKAPRADEPRARDRRPERETRPIAKGRPTFGRPDQPFAGSSEPVRRDRPTAGTRKHVATLRAEAATDSKRRRVERSDTKDRRDRTVVVERLVGPASIKPERHAGNAGRRGAARFTPWEGKPDHASPSARAKRERIAKSGSAGARDGDGAAGRSRRDEPRSSSDARRSTRSADAPPSRADRPGGPKGGSRSDAFRSEKASPSGKPRRNGDRDGAGRKGKDGRPVAKATQGLGADKTPSRGARSERVVGAPGKIRPSRPASSVAKGKLKSSKPPSAPRRPR